MGSRIHTSSSRLHLRANALVDSKADESLQNNVKADFHCYINCCFFSNIIIELQNDKCHTAFDNCFNKDSRQPKKTLEASTLQCLTIKELAQLLHQVFLHTMSQDVAVPLFNNHKGPQSCLKQALTRHNVLVPNPLLS